MCFSSYFSVFSDKNQVFGWGNSEYNQLHLNDSKQQMNTPIYLNMIENCGKIIDIASGGSICMVLNGMCIVQALQLKLTPIPRKFQ